MRDLFDRLSRRERQIVHVLVSSGESGVEEVRNLIPDPPSYDSVRTTLRILEEKGVVEHRRDGRRFLYRCIEEAEGLRENALSFVVDRFFGGRTEVAALALLRSADLDVGEEELARLEAMLRRGDE